MWLINVTSCVSLRYFELGFVLFFNRHESTQFLLHNGLLEWHIFLLRAYFLCISQAVFTDLMTFYLLSVDMEFVPFLLDTAYKLQQEKTFFHWCSFVICFASCVFNDEIMHQIGNAPGPLKWVCILFNKLSDLLLCYFMKLVTISFNAWQTVCSKSSWGRNKESSYNSFGCTALNGVVALKS